MMDTTMCEIVLLEPTHCLKMDPVLCAQQEASAQLTIQLLLHALLANSLSQEQHNASTVPQALNAQTLMVAVSLCVDKESIVLVA